MKPLIRNKNLVLPELSYEVVGALFEVFHELGGGYQEKHYYRAVRGALVKRGLVVCEQVQVPVKFQDAKIGRLFLDFLINDQIVLELKVGARFRESDFDQAKVYLKAASKPLAILARFSKDGVTYHRVLPLKGS